MCPKIGTFIAAYRWRRKRFVERISVASSSGFCPRNLAKFSLVITRHSVFSDAVAEYLRSAALYTSAATPNDSPTPREPARMRSSPLPRRALASIVMSTRPLRMM